MSKTKTLKVDFSEEELAFYYRWAAEHQLEDPAIRSLYEKLESKLTKILEHEYYTEFKCAPTEEQREEARQLYLDSKGVPEAFRWSKLRDERKDS